ncbi:MAG: hypothetical protein COT73_08295 [Bdellovibrio sp. CG10_big_fil_rev_8_21_14_0_10_47_8]|nr:MAG: hypothetical protein COT73_08295 [Bdellovibrio sp. CG10_big_fil_rev_8_21_14_0_10_47_8]
MKALFSFFTVALLFVSNAAWAGDFAVAVGFRSNSADADVSGYTITSKTGYGLGAIGFFDVGNQLQVRSGFLYNQRNYTLTQTGVPDKDLNMSYVDIPVTAMYKFADYAGAFAGPVFGLLASKECKASGGCSSVENPSSMVVGFQMGASFKFAPQMGGEIYYEIIPTKFWKNLAENARTVGANFLITFE